MKRTAIILTAAVALAATACRKHGNDLMNPDTAQYSTPLEQFEAIWNGINNGYAFWDIDPTDWDSIYNAYRSVFEDLDDADTIATATLKGYYDDMCGRFVDHHMAVVVRNLKPAPHDKATVFAIQPGKAEAHRRGYYHDKFSDSLLIGCIEKLEKAEMAYAANDKGSALACDIDGIAYLKLSGYMLTAALNATDSASQAIAGVYRKFRNWTTADSVKGIIIDNRGNGGGYLNDMDYVVAPFIDGDMRLGDTRRKEGLGRYDYTVWIPLTVQPADTAGTPDVPIVALADINSASMGELTTYAIAQMPKGCFIGERTFGAHGPLFGDFEINYGGTFGDSQLQSTAHYVYMSNNVFRCANGQIREGKGFVPTREVLYDDAQMHAGNDVQLNAAIDYIRRGGIK